MFRTRGDSISSLILVTRWGGLFAGTASPSVEQEFPLIRKASCLLRATCRHHELGVPGDFSVTSSRPVAGNHPCLQIRGCYGNPKSQGGAWTHASMGGGLSGVLREWKLPRTLTATVFPGSEILPHGGVVRYRRNFFFSLKIPLLSYSPFLPGMPFLVCFFQERLDSLTRSPKWHSAWGYVNVSQTPTDHIFLV